MLQHDVLPEALDVADDYGLNELGENHRSLTDVFGEIATARTWWVATTRPNGSPHAVPVWGVVVDDHMLFCSDAKSRKSAHLRANPKVVVHLESGDDVTIVEAATRVVEASELPVGFVEVYNAKYDHAPDPTAAAFMTHEVLPTKIFSWLESDFAATAVRWRFNT